MKVNITDDLKRTVTDSNRFKTLSIVLESQGICVKEFKRLGITPETMSFFCVALDKISAELAEAAEYVKLQTVFNNITKGLPDGSEKEPEA